MPRVIPPGQEDVVQAILPAEVSPGWRRARVTVHPRFIEAEYEHDSGARTLVTIRHAGEGAPTRSLTTDALSVQASTTDGAGADLLARITQRARQQGDRLRWIDAEPLGTRHGATDETFSVDPEWESVEAGLKPGVRVCTTSRRADEVARRLEIRGAHVQRQRHRGTQDLEIVYAAPSARVAEQLRTTEGAALDRPGGPRAADHLALGQLLGYPACCVKAFAEVVGLDQTFAEHSTTEAYAGACAAWTPRPRHRLNDLLIREVTGLIPFHPCRYDCSAALEYADALATHLARVAPAWLERTDRLLRCCVAIDQSGARAIAEIDATGRRVSSARSPADHVGEHAPPDVERPTADAALARRVVGQEVRSPGSRAWRPGDVTLVEFV